MEAELAATYARYQALAKWAASTPGADEAGAKAHGDTEPPRRLVGEDCPILASRRAVTDIARIAEQLVMDDMPRDYWPIPVHPPAPAPPTEAEAEADAEAQAAAEVQAEAEAEAEVEVSLEAARRVHARRLSCRERRAFFAADRVGDIIARADGDAEQCEVRRRRAGWALELQQRYGARVLEWIDTGVGQEKQAAVIRLHAAGRAPDSSAIIEPPAEPMIIVAFRGSKQLTDFLLTDVSISLTPLPEHPDAACTVGLWQAYAGNEAKRGGESPRARVRRAVESALEADPSARLCCTGHSLGGALATLCAYDLLTSSGIVAGRGCSVVSLAGPRFFDAGFQRAASALERAGKLHAVRVMVHDDLVPRLPPRQLGMMGGVSARLILDPANDKGLGTLRYVDADDESLDRMWGADVTSHTCHAVYLASETTAERSITLPPDGAVRWPLVATAA